MKPRKITINATIIGTKKIQIDNKTVYAYITNLIGEDGSNVLITNDSKGCLWDDRKELKIKTLAKEAREEATIDLFFKEPITKLRKGVPPIE